MYQLLFCTTALVVLNWSRSELEKVSYAKKYLELDAMFHGKKGRAQQGFPTGPPPATFPNNPPPSTFPTEGPPSTFPNQPPPSEFPTGPPSELPPPRTTRQTATFICVPPGTCISNATAPPGIDPRIITPNATTAAPPTPAPAPCPSGTVACYQVAGGPQCGQRYVTNPATADGPATAGAYPWQAYIRNQSGFTGSGVLVDNMHVITAAHKVNLNVNTSSNVIVNIGVSDPRTSLTTSQQRTVARIFLHERFNPTTLKDDIAILRLNASISLGFQMNVGTACLAAANTSFVNQNCLVSGWGRTSFTSNDAPTSPQKQVTVSIVNGTECRRSLAQNNVLGSNVDYYLDQAGEICAGGQANRDACTSDGGSPLVCPVNGRYTVAGLVIWGKGCGATGVYGVYVNVPYYRTWIDNTIRTLSAG